KLVVLDRPNPVGGLVVEGRVLDPGCFSFVGPYPLPMRHGLSLGEAAILFNEEIGADLEVIRMHYWDATRNFSELGRYWVPTSPNLPTMDSVVVYPGLVMIEGTNLSEGRGTTLPFQLIGAPYLKSADQFVTRVLELLRPVG